MPRRCSVCHRADRVSIDTALVAARAPLRTLAGQFGVSPSALQRHRNEHLSAVLLKGRAEADLAGARSLLDYVRALQARSIALLEKAEATGDLRVALGALRELRGIAELTIRAAERGGESVPGAVVKAYVQKLIDVLHEFVAPDRIDAALMKVQHLTESEMVPQPSDADQNRRG
jgi:hypothetical protein